MLRSFHRNRENDNTTHDMKSATLISLFAAFFIGAHSSSESKREWLNKMEALRSVIKQHPEVVAGQGQERHEYGTTGTADFNVDFQCTPEPITIHRLRPQDIDVIGAMGDSITAGFGCAAENVLQLTEDRGLSWSVGGDGSLPDTMTVTNILREFNPNIQGYSTGSGRNSEDWFNVAVGGARAHDMPGQARRLVNNMKLDSRVNFEHDWKLVTMFIGGNDLCALGRDYEDANAYAYRDYIEEALDILHAQLPKTFVNIVDILEIYLLPNVSGGFGAPSNCGLTQSLVCGYVVDADKEQQEFVIKENHLYQTLVQQLIDSGKYDTHDDFTVVIQPFLRDTVLPYTDDGQVDATYFAPDCFHFSAKGHAMGAINIWNNMLEPVGQKSTVWTISDLKSPTKDSPYFFTRLNSGLEGSGSTPPLTTTTRPTTTTPAAITTTTSTAQPITTTTEGKPIECKPQECTTIAPDWIIAVICVLAVTLAFQTLILVYGCCRSSTKKHRLESFDSFSSTHSVTKM